MTGRVEIRTELACSTGEGRGVRAQHVETGVVRAPEPSGGAPEERAQENQTGGKSHNQTVHVDGFYTAQVPPCPDEPLNHTICQQETNGTPAADRTQLSVRCS